MADQTPATIPPSEREKVARDEKQNAMRDLREDARERGDRPHDHAGEPGQWPGKELTRNTVPHPDEDLDRESLPDDVQRDISQEGITHDPEKTVERAP